MNDFERVCFKIDEIVEERLSKIRIKERKPPSPL
jgi:hypothetical protein